MNRVVLFLTGCLLLLGCGDFLKERSAELTYATSCTDLDEILIGDGYMKYDKGLNTTSVSKNQYYYSWAFVMDDDVEEFAFEEFGATSNIMEFRPFYSWAKELFMNPQTLNLEDDQCWEKLYAHISIVNLIIAQVKEFPEDPIELQNRVKGEALFLRAAYYYLLVNFYAPPYSKTTASTDLGVPLKLTEYVEDKYYSRNTVKEVYDQIVKDLKEAVTLLTGIEQTTFYRANVRAARLLLSRVYLYMEEWALAKEECRKLIEEDKVKLWDLNISDWQDIKERDGSYSKKQYILSLESPEILFTAGNSIITRLFSPTGKLGYIASSDLLDNYYYESDVEDIRRSAFFAPSSSSNQRIIPRKNYIEGVDANVFETFVLRSAEAYLNKMEAEAMLDDAGVVNTMKAFMATRFAGGNLPAIEHLSGKELVEFIRAERRREFCFEHQRWFDLRRYAVNTRYPSAKEIHHPVYVSMGGAAQFEGNYVLKSYAEDAPAYTLPIPQQEIDFNKGSMEQNAERTEREIGN